MPFVLYRFYEEVCLVDQKYVMDDGEGKKVKDVISAMGKQLSVTLELTSYFRIECGEGIEKEHTDFAEEVCPPCPRLCMSLVAAVGWTECCERMGADAELAASAGEEDCGTLKRWGVLHTSRTENCVWRAPPVVNTGRNAHERTLLEMPSGTLRPASSAG